MHAMAATHSCLHPNEVRSECDGVRKLVNAGSGGNVGRGTYIKSSCGILVTAFLLASSAIIAFFLFLFTTRLACQQTQNLDDVFSKEKKTHKDLSN